MPRQVRARKNRGEVSMRANVPRVLIAATGSGVGKTTVTCGLLRALQARGLRLCAFKCGPDYLDPQFHSSVLDVPSRNLDLFMAGQDLVCELVAQNAGSCDLTVIEGAMGYYDGIAQSHDASAYDVARVTQTPCVLVVDARGKALSVAAEVQGFAQFEQPSHVSGVILNRVSESYAPLLAATVQERTGIPVLGFVPRLSDAELPSRHLGLVVASEVGDLDRRLDLLAAAVERTVDLDALALLAKEAPALEYESRELPEPCQGHPVIAVARDEAFCFYYEDSLALLRQLGARLAFFSPLRDDALPRDASGLYLGGGYPELHARELSRNNPMLKQVRAAIDAGMPTIAECGGFLYLHHTLEDDEGSSWPMVGAVDGNAFGRGRLGRFGYVTLEAAEDGLLCKRGDCMPAHEFHYWDSTASGNSFHAQKPQSARGWDCVVGSPTLYAGFPHLYLNGCPDAARRFVEACANYDRRGRAM